MATGDTLNGQNTKLWILDADSDNADILSDTSKFEADVTGYNTSGGAQDFDSEAVFGGFIDLDKPEEATEISFDIIYRHGTAQRWRDLKTGGARHMVAIQNTRGTDYYWVAFNNVKVINLEDEFNADDNWRATITFKVSAKTAEGLSNFQSGEDGAASDATHGVQDWAENSI